MRGGAIFSREIVSIDVDSARLISAIHSDTWKLGKQVRDLLGLPEGFISIVHH